MDNTLFFAVLAVFSVVDAGYVPDDCLHCICYVESKCCMPKRGSGTYSHCVMDVGSYSCGPYQIKEAYWMDARLKGGHLKGDWLSCTADWQCTADAVNGYMKRYATKQRLGTDPTCEHFSRIHNGGPDGNRVPATLKYWQNVNNCLQRHLCCDPYPPRCATPGAKELLESILLHKKHHNN